MVQFQFVVTTNGKIVEIIGPFCGADWNQDKHIFDMCAIGDQFFKDIKNKYKFLDQAGKFYILIKKNVFFLMQN